ncbi:hypothetical protein CPB86DRAFT_869830 [Serendipita vermifera]|nr:hypothetical protein CPB86DRAFT_869830 [Serendipita vermifera]
MSNIPIGMPASCAVNRLPIELLREIFLSYYCCRLGRPTKLLSVCRRWCIIARETQTLWSIIHFHICASRKSCSRKEHLGLEKYAWEYSMAVGYFSLGELRKGIEQLGAMQFTLLLDLCNGGPAVPQADNLPAIISLVGNQCTSLVLSTTFLIYDPYMLLTNIQSIKSLNIVGRFTLPMDYRIFNFCTLLANNTRPLRSLRFNGMLPSAILRHSRIFRRLHHLYLNIPENENWGIDDWRQLGSLLEEVRTLSLEGFSTLPWQPTIPITSRHLVHLSLSFVSPFSFLNSAYQSLVALSLERENHTDVNALISSSATIQLPSLRYLIYRGSLACLLKIWAPNLLILAVRSEFNATRSHQSVEEIFVSQGLSMNPRYAILDIKSATASFIEAFLASASSIVDLETTFHEWSLSSSTFPQLLSDTRQNSLCPNLRNLRVAVQCNDGTWITGTRNWISAWRAVLLCRKESSQVASLQSLKYRIGKDSDFDSCHGMGRVNELWERNIRDGSQDTWERERERLLFRPGWTDIQA